ncbi:MAG: aldehyde dehydrogenase [Cyclobacteriaceae bacterium]|nr:MAG: aldehyde dehydrogenase [Cyclobacteriaceae bacterium]
MAIQTDTLVFQAREVFEKQRKFSGQLRSEPLKARKRRLSSIINWVKAHREKIHEALNRDLCKPSAETDATEIIPVITEARHALTHLDEWVRPRKVDAPLTMLGTRSVLQPEPKGVCLVISPWNYPFSLAAGPLISALAAGNTVVIKPSEHVPHTARLLREMTEALFTEQEVAVFEGGPEVSHALLALPFNHIFFTGSTAVGKLVMKAAAEHLSSVTLELGGKSPALVLPSARLKMAARRIAVTKFVNNGQTCVAPDYVLVHQSRLNEFIEELRTETLKLFSEGGQPMENSPHYGRIINQSHFNRLQKLVEDAIARGARPELSGTVSSADRFMHPIILSQVPEDALLMQEEIFGPVLPVFTFTHLNQALDFIAGKPSPLALYIFGTDNAETRKIINQTASGAVCVNDCAIHFLHPNLPFGGVNHSGIGKAHGYYGFQAFSNEKPVLVQRKTLTSVSFFYPPYTGRVKRLMNWLIRML